MAQQETERRPSPENGNLIHVEPAELMQDNPAALIVNYESYRRMEAYFSPDQLDPPQVVRVRTYSSEHGEVVKLFVIDGLTRTKYAADHKGATLADYPDFNFDTIMVRDVTKTLLKNSEIVPQQERQDTQDELTMVQFLRAVVPPTREHSAIAPDRIAAHLINAWDNMVGEELAKRFSAMEALSFISNREVPAATEQMLRRFIESQQELVSGETADERTLLQEALVQTAVIIREAKLFREQVARSAFELVSAQSPVIGGERESREQIYGLLHAPFVEQKLAKEFPSLAIREQKRRELAEKIEDALLVRFAQLPDIGTITDTIVRALRNPQMSFNHIIEILASDSPVEKYTQISQGINRGKLEENYLSTEQVTGSLTQVELRLIGQLGGKTFLAESELPIIARNIKKATGVLQEAQEYTAQVNSDIDKLLENGARSQTIEEGLQKIESAKELILNANTPQTLLARSRQLRLEIANLNRLIDRQLKLHRVNIVVGNELGQTNSQIAVFVFREIDPDRHLTVDESFDNLVKGKLNELRSVDEDLQREVVAGHISLSVATRRHFARRQEPQRSQTGVSQPREDAISVHTPTLEVQPGGLEPGVTVSEEENALTEKDVAERRRITTGKRRLNQMLDSMISTGQYIDLKPEEVSEEEKQKIRHTLNMLGGILYGDQSRIVRVIEEDYPDLLKRLTRVMEVRVQQETEETSRDARTRI